MIDYRDRIPSRPGRRKITHADGSIEYVTIEMADEPTVVGTPLNRANYMALQGFTNENTTISIDGNVTTITTNHADGGRTVATITRTSDTHTKVVETYTGPSGLVNRKETTININGSTITIGGVTS